ncbi:hypothetical protein HU200_043100 [Digitaria exilis]|uniref:Uncharacterized protein n=1 Tax=Digitaria exilis TaxID=1010633 RepID=A0A835EEC3_9POAL|nr:hypothetical protein HU200_043100 [Digitaria exilis]
MAVRALRSKLSERIFTHVIEDARIMQHSLVNGTPPLAPQGTKIAPLVWIIWFDLLHLLNHACFWRIPGSGLALPAIFFQVFSFFLSGLVGIGDLVGRLAEQGGGGGRPVLVSIYHAHQLVYPMMYKLQTLVVP